MSKTARGRPTRQSTEESSQQAQACDECGGSVVEDGVEQICQDCGLVVGEYTIDHGAEWRHDEALNDGRYECGHCQADEYLGSKQHGERVATKLSKADPDEVAPTEFDRERASVSLAWFVAVWLAIMAASTFTGVMLYFAGVLL